MFKYDVEVVKDEENITKIINTFTRQELPRFNKLENYYSADNKINKRSVKAPKPNNKLSHAFAKYITNMATGYFIGKGVKVELSNENYKNELTDILDFNYTDNDYFEIAKEASKKGIAYEILFLDEKKRLKTEKLKAENVIPIYSPKLGNFLECAIRLWQEVDIKGKKNNFAELYTDNLIIQYKQDPASKKYSKVDETAHSLGDIPFIVYWNNEEQTSDYEFIISSIDAYDLAQSDTANDNEYFTDAYLAISGALGGFDSGYSDDDSKDDSEERESEDEAFKKAMRTFREERVLMFDEKGQAQWLIKNVNDAAVENYKNRLKNDTFLFAQVPAMSDESFAGNLTGVAIRYKLIGVEQLAIMKEHKFKSAIKKKLKIITDYINTLENSSYSANNITIKIERNFIDNLTETIENVEKLDGKISRRTLLSLLPFVKDVDEELAQMELEQKGFKNRNKINSSDYTFDEEE